MLRSIIQMLGLDLPVPDHTTLSRRSARLSLTTTLKKPKGPVNVVIDSSGLKIFGSGCMRSTAASRAAAGAGCTWLSIPTAVTSWLPS
jgi:anti-anti-sigma regulatory factor